MTRACGLLATTTVGVVRRVRTGTDGFGMPTYGDETVEEVGPVLVTPGSTSDLEASRPEGARVAVTVHFPKTYDAPLKGCEVEWGGARYRVIGDPVPYMAGNVPGAFDRPVECERVDG